mmetsp:Transcript_10255/g.33856  ORF Transcript_10255/g.33856 Transcript_10255/m.33856 type:complete len:201 (+) Transcript_10255:725-1327(+)
MTRGCRTRSAEAACFPRPPVGVTRLASAAMPSEVLETKEPMPPTGLVTKPITPCAAPFQKPACPPSIAPRIGSSTIPATPPSIPSPNARMPTRKPSPALPTAACWTRARRSLYHGSRESAPDTLDTPPAKLETRVSAPAAVPPATPPAKERVPSRSPLSPFSLLRSEKTPRETSLSTVEGLPKASRLPSMRYSCCTPSCA